MKDPLRLLMVEDDASDAELVRFELEKGGFDLDWRCVATEPAMLEALSRPWDVIISDFTMPRFSGIKAFDLYRRLGDDVPFIFVSGDLGEERAVEAMRAGARDYFVKGNLARLPEAVRRELHEAKNRREQRQAAEQQRREQRRLALAIEASNAGVFELDLDPEGPVEYSGAWRAILGFPIAELPTRSKDLHAWLVERLHPEDEATVIGAVDAFCAEPIDRLRINLRLLHKDGRWADVTVCARAMDAGDHGRAVHLGGVILDRSSGKLLEAQLRQAQKMEALGQLAGGVAHDFNNLLTAILSFSTFAQEAMRPGSPECQDIQEVLHAAERAKSLTNQLLAFSRKKAIAPRILNPNEVVEAAERILGRLLGEDVDLLVQKAPNLGNVKIDPDAFEQVLLNLAVNARDAMPDGGKLTIETSNVFIDRVPGAPGEPEVASGHYVVAAVSDTGAGMDAATQMRIFEPFFTTKGPGKGTGLGLSTCYGIVKQADGFISVYSEVGKGTTFRVHLPLVAHPGPVATAREPRVALGGNETILVAEDDEQVRQLVVRSLTNFGYTVIQAGNGQEALMRLSEPVHVDLLLTDVVMPVMDGKQLVEQMKVLRPSLPAVFMSGYPRGAITHRGVIESGTEIIQKPFTPDVLARRVREMLDARTKRA
ncbi:MAG TPA: response regulator [Polyangia bacterium]|nr:response regulator [Polyangia bacterium]